MNLALGSMGLVYLPTDPWLISMVRVSKYTSPMDPMGITTRNTTFIWGIERNPGCLGYIGDYTT